MKEQMCGQMKRTIIIVIVLLLASFGVLMYCEWRGNLPDTLYVCRKMLLSMPVTGVLIGMAHYHAARGLSNREYITQMFCGKSVSGNRKVYLDHARILAAVIVILTHACSNQVDADAALWKINTLLVCMGIGLISANALFVMISGSLLLSTEKEEKIGTFYFKRFVKVILPMLIYYVVFLCVSGQISLIPPENLKEGALQILAGESGIVPHFWLIYTLISLYISAPFIRVMLKNLDDSKITALFWIILIEEVLSVYLPFAGVQIGFTLNLANWEGVFILGYIFTERRTKWMEKFVVISGAVSAAVVVFIMVFNFSLKDYVCTLPVMSFFAGALLIVLSKQKNKEGSLSLVMRSLSKYSYSIILVHWYGLFVVVWGKMGIQPLRFGCIGGILMTVLASVIVCFILGFIADNTIVLIMQSIVSGLVGLRKRS